MDRDRPAALSADVVVIPFGGGTNISGCLEPPAGETRRSSRSTWDGWTGDGDRQRLAPRPRAGGVLGPRLEEQLGARGYTFGHFPDSFTYSTLGGWIATRSSGMQSDRYGDIAEMVRAPRRDAFGVLVTAPVPRSRRVRTCARWCSGARVGWGSSPRRPCRYGGTREPQDPRLSVPHFSDALAAMSEIAASETRLGDPGVGPARDAVLVRHAESIRPWWTRLQSRRYGVPAPAPGLRSRPDVPRVHRLRGQRAAREAERRAVGKIVKRHGGLASGRAPASSTTRRSSTSRTSVTSCSRGAPRRRLGDPATGASCPRCMTG